MIPLTVDVCIVGGGPAGLTLGLELARDGCVVAVVEQSGHFNRSFRGESISPDAVLLLDRLGLLGDIMAAGSLVTRRMEITENGRVVMRTEFDDFDYEYRYPMEVPQPTLLGALAAAAGRNTNFSLIRRTSVVNLVKQDDVVTGIRCIGPDGEVVIKARLTVGADGRYSKVLDMSGLSYRRLPLERDVVWMKLPLPSGWDPETYRIRIKGDHHGLFIPTYPDLMRVGFNIPKGGLKELRQQGIEALYARLDELAPELTAAARTAITGWSDTSLLDIFTSIVPQWSRPGLTLIGDAAHTLSPILGQGVNHALMDAMALAPLIFEALDRGGRPATLMSATDEFQRTREPDVRRARSLQLRQERMFTFGNRPAVLLRTMVYRALNSSSFLRNRVLSDVYFPLQKRGRNGGAGVTHPDAPRLQ
jgi:2-polyprenyl-6-methoxyphenol hydroxylase-like FAD-dependent oxidoreductase